MKTDGLYQTIFVSDSTATRRIPGISDLFRLIGQYCPLIQLSVNDSDLLNEIKPDPASTLFVYIHIPLIEGTLPSTKIMNAMMEASYGRKRVRYLIIHYSKSNNDDVREILKYAWRRQGVQCAILELLYYLNQNMQDEIFQAVVHQYNPFMDKFTSENFSSQTELFPIAANNMNGYPFKIRIAHDPPFSTVRYGSNGKITLKGANMRLINALAESMNFTIEAQVQERLSADGRLNSFLQPLVNKQMDMYAHIVANPSEQAEVRSLRTRSVHVDQLCAIVPYIAKKNSQLLSMNTVGAYLLILIIVVVFWTLEHLTHLDSKYWSPFIVMKLLLGVTVEKTPNYTADRIMFGALCLVSIMYSTNLYSSLTGEIVHIDEVNEWSTLEDLVNSDLVPIISPLYYNKTFSYASGVQLQLKAKVQMTSWNMMDCLNYLVEYKNISCIMREKAYNVFEQYESIRRSVLLKPCLIADSFAFPIAKNSPYRERIDDLIGVFRDVGLLNKWYDIGFSRRQNITPEENDDARDVLMEKHNLFQQFAIIMIVGYTSASIALLGELIFYHKFDKKRHSPKAGNCNTYAKRSLMRISRE
ncbi:uncharacterized protein Ir7e isoform X2 [Diachasmimorpha longicaudata]